MPLPKTLITYIWNEKILEKSERFIRIETKFIRCILQDVFKSLEDKDKWLRSTVLLWFMRKI